MEEYLQEYFIGTNEYGGIPIIKDNCEDLFDNWLQGLDVDEWFSLADRYAKIRFIEGEISGLKKGQEILVEQNKIINLEVQ